MKPTELPVGVDADSNFCPICEKTYTDQDSFVIRKYLNQFDQWVIVSYHEGCYIEREAMFWHLKKVG